MIETFDADTRLAVYGTLAPGRPNHHQIAGLNGKWSDGSVRGRLVEAGWGASMGYPGIIVDESAQQTEVVLVRVFESHDLPAHWHRLDSFEGPGYRRVPVKVETTDGVVIASIYALAIG